MAADLDNVFWLGGSTCSGKTTTARCLARRFGLRLYSTDDSFDEHLQRIQKELHPTIYDFEYTKGWMERVQSQAIDIRVDIWRLFYKERFTLILSDLEKLQDDTILVEGVELFPEYVLPYSPISKMAWFVPTQSFFEQHYYMRPWVTESPSKETWLYYEAMIKCIRSQVTYNDGILIENDGNTAPESIADRLAIKFDLI